MVSKLWRLAFSLLFLTTIISGIVNVEASGNAPSLLGINARQGIFSIHAMNPIKFVDHAKTVTQQQETVPQQQEIATPATQGKTQKPVTLILYIEEVRPDGSVMPVPRC